MEKAVEKWGITMNVKRITASLVLGAVLLSAVGCSSGGGSAQSAASSAAPAPASSGKEPAASSSAPQQQESISGYTDDESERCSFTIMMGKQFDVPPGNPVEQFLGEKFNCDLEFMLVPRGTDDYLNKCNLVLASGEYPDLIQFDRPAIVQTYVDENVLIPLDGLVQEYGQEILAIRPDDLWINCTYNGQRMVTPVQSRTACVVPIIRMDWLEKLNLKVPETLEEYENVIRAFTEDDPDGNGQKDTYGISGPNNPSTEWFTQAFAYCGVWPYDWQERDGKLVRGSIMPEMKEALKLINKWYTNGWIDPEFALYSRDKFEEVLGFGTFGSYSYDPQRLDPAFDIGLKALYEKQPDALFAAYKPIKDKDGNPGQLHHPDNRSGIFFGITTACENPARAMKICNYIGSEEGYVRVRYGEEGVQYEIKDGQMQFIGEWGDINKRTQEGLSIQYCNIMRREYEDRMGNGTMQDALAMMRENMVPSSPIFVTTPANLEYDTLLRQLETEAFVQIITAPKGTDVDTVFDEYVEKWLSTGGQQVTDAINEEYAKVK
ncbi:MAG: extracellular solute-binding protein [Provencibacterium sp.]|nr:extracellular solute-binding protein [Provencibacterium sp.]